MNLYNRPALTGKPFGKGNVVPFPARGPFAICIERERDEMAWLVIGRHHGWAFGSLREARDEAAQLAGGFGVAVVEKGAR